MANTTGKKFGGRQKGTKNKRSQAIEDLAAEMGCNPARIVMHFAMGDHEALDLPEYYDKVTKSGEVVQVPSIDSDMRKDAATSLLPYLYPKLKNIEHSGEVKGGLLAEVLAELDEDSEEDESGD